MSSAPLYTWLRCHMTEVGVGTRDVVGAQFPALIAISSMETWLLATVVRWVWQELGCCHCGEEPPVLMDRSRCLPPLASPKRSRVWNWFCSYLPAGPSLYPLVSGSHNSVQKTSHHRNTEHPCTNEDSVNNRLMFSVYDALNVRMMDGAANSRLWAFLFLTFFSFFSPTCCSGWQADR